MHNPCWFIIQTTGVLFSVGEDEQILSPLRRCGLHIDELEPLQPLSTEEHMHPQKRPGQSHLRENRGQESPKASINITGVNF